MRVPVWLTLGVAVLVCVFGAYRIRLAFRSDEEDERARARKGLYAMARRTHLLIGVVYLLLGAGLIATSFGWSPLGSLFDPTTTAPKATPPAKPAPATGSAPAEQPRSK
jgi:uncharacterized iron-regulated membrane protein